MTCIIGYKFKDHVWMIADSASGDDWTEESSKLVESGPFLFGFTISWRLIQLVRHNFDYIQIDMTQDKDVIAYNVCEQIRQIAKDHGYLHIEDSQETIPYINNSNFGPSVLVAWENNLFCISGDFSYSRSFDPYEAVGYGRNSALAVCKTIESFDELFDMYSFRWTEEGRLTKIIDLVCKLNPSGVRPPYRILNTIR